MEPPTEADRDSLLRWKAKARLAQLLRPDLSEAVAAYLHFLNGSGAYLAVNYDDYVESDKAGQRTLQSLVEDIRFSAFELHRALGGGTRNFLMQSDVVAAGDFKKDGTPANGRYPYPGTENWQKTIGAHLLWVEAEVSAHEESSAVVCDVIATVKVEDMYNFNPDNVDIATGIPDSENGRFEIVGLGHEFLSKATLVRRIRFSASRDGVSSNGLDERVEVKKP